MKKVCIITLLIWGLLLTGFSVGLAGDKPTFEFKPYGKFKLDGSYDQNLTSHGNFQMWVNQPNADYVGDDDQFNMTANETRLGLNVTSKGYENVKVGAKVEFDLYGSVSGGTVAENTAMLMLRHAYFTLQHGNFKLLAGQSWDLISPLNAPTLNYPVLWGCGNTGYRRPQVSLWYNFDAGTNTNITWAGGFFRTIGSDLTPTFQLALDEESDGPDDGTDAGIPSFQGLLDVKHSFPSGASVRFGASGLWGQLKAETNLGNYETYENWAFVGHLAVSWQKNFGVLGEFFTGNNMGSYFGGVLQSSTIGGVNTTGGWGTAWFKVSPKVKFAAGYGFDDPDNADLTSGRSKNTAFFGNIKYNVVSNVTLGVEVSQWETEYVDASATTSTYDNLRIQTSFILAY